MQEIVIGWPEGIFLTITFLNLSIVAASHGEDKNEKYNFYVTLTSTIICNTLLLLGGFYF